MANLVIKRDLATFKGVSPPALTIFKNADGHHAPALPKIDGKMVTWTVADPPENRTLFRRNCEPSGLHSCEAIDQKAPEAFNVKAVPVTYAAPPKRPAPPRKR